MNNPNNLNILKFQFTFFYLLFIFSANSQINRVVFQDDFEDNAKSTLLWGQSAKYSFTTGFPGSGLLFNSTAPVNLLVSTPITIDNLQEYTIALSASIKGENLTGGGNPGMVVQLVLTTTTGSLRYGRIAVETGTFDWKNVGRIYKIDADVVSAKLEIGIYNATGKFWLDNLHIQITAEPMPPARDPGIPINKTHEGMYTGMNVVYSSNSAKNIITKSSLDELRYDWKANSVRVMIGGEKYYPGGLQLTDYEAILQAELVRMDTLVKWCNANGLRMIVGLAGLSDGLFKSKAAQTRLVDAWKLISSRYKNDDAVWAYDLANEPIVSPYPYNYTYPLDNSILMWPLLADTLVKAIREIDAEKAIIIESLNYSMNMDDIRPIDASIPNIIYSVHMYTPHSLTHQQMSSQTPAYTYPGTIDGKYYDKNSLKLALQPIKNYQDKYRVPIYIGEFSCIRWAPGNSAYNYLRDCIEIFEEYGWDWSYHSFRTWDGWSLEHSTGWYDSVFPATKTDREMLFRSYFQQSTTHIQTFRKQNISDKLYPNPAKNEVFIKVQEYGLNAKHISIYDAQGKVLSNLNITGVEVLRLDVSSFPDGLYMFKLSNESEKISGRFLKTDI
jgi:endoglucanase